MKQRVQSLNILRFFITELDDIHIVIMNRQIILKKHFITNNECPVYGGVKCVSLIELTVQWIN